MESNLNKVLNTKTHQLCGQLYKYTNVMKGNNLRLCFFLSFFINKKNIFFSNKGWQYRWFTVDGQAGTLCYYLFEASGDDNQPNISILGSSPRGQVIENLL